MTTKYLNNEEFDGENVFNSKPAGFAHGQEEIL